MTFSIDDFGDGTPPVDHHRCIECPECEACGERFRWFHETPDHCHAHPGHNVYIWRRRGQEGMEVVHSCGCAACLPSLIAIQAGFAYRKKTKLVGLTAYGR